MRAKYIIAPPLLLICLTSNAFSEENMNFLSQEKKEFETPIPGTQIIFPKDHGAHTKFRTEWWYLTTNLRGDDGKQYGCQWTLFRHASEPLTRNGWEDRTMWMGHAAITSENNHLYTETLARGGVGQAAVENDPFNAFIDDWSFTALDNNFSKALVTASADDFSYRLHLERTMPFVLQGVAGYSLKSQQGQASYYYSQPFFRVDGELKINKRSVHVVGQGWMDREWSSQILAPDQKGWDWFSLHLSDGSKVMLFRLRGNLTYLSGNWIMPNGDTTALTANEIKLEPLEETKIDRHLVPTRWRVNISSHHLLIETTPLNPNSWMSVSFPYWEGPISFTGTSQGTGYLEMTGY